MPAGELKAAVVGAAGYVGGELLRLLQSHPRVGAVRAFSSSHAGQAWGAAHPALRHGAAGVFESGDDDALVQDGAAWADVVFVALPHGASQQRMASWLAADPPLVVDLAADFRVHDATLYEAYYGPHRAPEHLDSFVYGLADVLGHQLEGARRIASPGCFATACLLGLYPLAQAGLLDGPAVCFGVTGSSGSGVQPKTTTHHPTRAHNLFGYSLGGHRHEAEITEQLQRWAPEANCRLLTHSGPFVRGIHATLHARLNRPVPELDALYQKAYAQRPFVQLETTPPQLCDVVGTNYAHLHAAARDDGREAVVCVTIDNLVKGAAGQAVQAMNLALGTGETTGLDFAGVYPC